MRQISYEQLKKNLQELLSCNAFEFHTNTTPKGTQNIYIPYMMNDALECYLLLEDGRLTGEYQKDFQADTTVELSITEQGPVLIFRQGVENFFTIWFESCYQSLTCYRYDQIGHFWVNGAEHWRRLVYIIGTIYDKYEYLGEQVCNEKELALLPLMEFGPFRSYSPIRESLDDAYPETIEGLETIELLAAEARDTEFLKFLKLYRRFPFRHTRRLLAKQLNHPSRIPLYELIWERIEEAAIVYPDRDYGEDFNQKISDARAEIEATLNSYGFFGEYPLFHKGTLQIYAVEEHPFTIMDWDHFSFRIQFMVSEAINPCSDLYYGFFKKSGNAGRIESSLEFLEHTN